MVEKKNKRVSGSGEKSHKLYIVDPESKMGMDSLVDRLMGLRPVRSISILYCEGGFFVRLGFFLDKEPENVLQYVRAKMAFESGYILPWQPAHA